MPQLDLFGGQPEKPNPAKTTASKKAKTPPTVVALHSDVPKVPSTRTSTTSKETIENIKKDAPSKQEQILAFIRQEGKRGATDDEIAHSLEMLSQTVNSRRVELRKNGLIVDSRKVRRTRTGRMGAVWIAVKGKENQAKTEEVPGENT